MTKDNKDARQLVMQMSSLVAYFLTHGILHTTLLDSLRHNIESYLHDQDIKEQDDEGAQ